MLRKIKNNPDRVDYFCYVEPIQLPSYTSHETPTELLNQFTGVYVVSITHLLAPPKNFSWGNHGTSQKSIKSITHPDEAARKFHGKITELRESQLKKQSLVKSKQGRIKKNNLSKNQLSGRRDKSKKATQTTFKLQTSNFQLPTSNDG